MAYDIVKFTDDAGHGVQITPDDVRRTFCANANDQEVQMFLALCATQHLNPFVKDAYLVKYGSGPASIITSRAAIQKRADSNPDFEGVELGVVVANAQGAVEHRPGEACYKVLGEQLLGGWARAYRKGRKPYYSEVPLAEYSTGKSNWQKMPGTMITKVAEMHALRGAFPQEFQGMYSSEEMAQAELKGTIPAGMTKADYADFKFNSAIVEEDGKLLWECPKCGNRDERKMNVCRRVCGYLGTNFFNQGRTQEIAERVLHL